MKLKNLNNRGFSHLGVVLAAVVGAGVIGTYMIVSSNAATLSEASNREAKLSVTSYGGKVDGYVVDVEIYGCGSPKIYNDKGRHTHTFNCGQGNKRIDLWVRWPQSKHNKHKNHYIYNIHGGQVTRISLL